MNKVTIQMGRLNWLVPGRSAGWSFSVKKQHKPLRLCQSYNCRILCNFFSFIQTKGVGLNPH